MEFNEGSSSDNNVQVIVRVRHLSSSEESSLENTSKCVRIESPQRITWLGNPESRFTFDLVADEDISQEMLFEVAGVPMVENCMRGYNSCMFAYGQAGSGKTYTIVGDIEGGTTRHSINWGMAPRVFELLFSRIQKEREARREENIRFTCKCPFLEIYNERIFDLLDPLSSGLQINICIVGIKSFPEHSRDKLCIFIYQDDARSRTNDGRHMGTATSINFMLSANLCVAFGLYTICVCYFLHLQLYDSGPIC